MNYKVLYRKYRPTNFDELVGQEHIKKILRNSIINNKIAHAYIFTGPRGTGKTSTAKIFARALNCLNLKDGIACGECDNCINFATNPDVIEIDAASNNGVENVRDIIENIGVAPAISKYKIYIIDEVHMLTQAAWNAFLKTLEEPPQNVIFILATTDIQKVPVTVLSRCQRFDFQRIDKNLIFDSLKDVCEKENIKYEDEALMEICYLSDGCMRDALSILDQLSKISEEITMEVIMNNYGTVSNNQIDMLYGYIINNDIDNLMSLITDIKNSGIDIRVFINKILDNFIEKAVNMKKKNIGSNAFSHIKNIIRSLNDLLNKINGNSNGFLMFELEMISFINDDDHKLSKREINNVSKELLASTENIDVNKLIVNKNDNNYYNVTKEFIDIRVNNAFAGASKDLKKEFIDLWKEFAKKVDKDNKIEFMNITKNSAPQVVSSTNVIFVTTTNSNKLVSNSKLHDIEVAFNLDKENKYKMIFITKEDWKKVLVGFDKEKEYQYIDDSEFINEDNSAVKMAENLFGDNINIV